MRRTAILVGAMAMLIVLVGGVALARSISCPNKDNRLCVGTNQADTMAGANRMDTIKARGGNDTVTARGGKDIVNGGDGGDFLDGGTGNDTLNGGPNPDNTNEFLDGATGNDTLAESPGPDRYGFLTGWGQDRITGDGDQLPLRDNDELCFACGTGVNAPLAINLAAGTATDGTNNVTWDAATEPFIEDVTGGSADDNIVGSRRANVVSGFNGADTINVSGDPTTASDFVSCGDGDGDADTVTKDPGDQLHQNCTSSDTIITVP